MKDIKTTTNALFLCVYSIDLGLQCYMDVTRLVKLTTWTENAVKIFINTKKQSTHCGTAQHTMLISINIKTGWLTWVRHAKYVIWDEMFGHFVYTTKIDTTKVTSNKPMQHYPSITKLGQAFLSSSFYTSKNHYHKCF